jgi:hypothetical protein
MLASLRAWALGPRGFASCETRYQLRREAPFKEELVAVAMHPGRPALLASTAAPEDGGGDDVGGEEGAAAAAGGWLRAAVAYWRSVVASGPPD